MTSSIIHFGVDVCERIPVLQSIGFRVDVCSSIDQLIEALQHDEADAVAVAARHELKVDSIVTAARSCSSSPLILFEDGPWQSCEADFDLVIPALTPPDQWLNDVAKLIARSKALHEEAEQLRAQSSTLRIESCAVRKRVTEQRERSRELGKEFRRPGNSGQRKAD